MTFDINSLRLPIEYARDYRERRKREAELFASDYATEKAASSLVKSFLDRQGWEYEQEVRT